MEILGLGTILGLLAAMLASVILTVHGVILAFKSHWALGVIAIALAGSGIPALFSFIKLAFGKDLNRDIVGALTK